MTRSYIGIAIMLVGAYILWESFRHSRLPTWEQARAQLEDQSFKVIRTKSWALVAAGTLFGLGLIVIGIAVAAMAPMSGN